MEYYPTDKLSDDDRTPEVDYLIRFINRRLQESDSVQCFLCGEPFRVLVVVLDDNESFKGYACVPCAASLDIVEHRRDAGCYQIGD